MGYTAKQFAADCRATLKADPGPAGRRTNMLTSRHPHLHWR